MADNMIADFEQALENFFSKFFGAKTASDPYNPYPGENATAWDAGPMESIDPGPIPVAITNPKEVTVTVPKGAQQFTTQHHYISNAQPILIAGANARRRAVTIVNKGAYNVAIDSSYNVRAGGPGNPDGSAELYPGDAVTLETTCEVYAIGANATGCDVMVWQMFDEGGSNQ